MPESPAPPSRRVAKHNLPELRKKITRPVIPTFSPVWVSAGEAHVSCLHPGQRGRPVDGDRIGVDPGVDESAALLATDLHLLREVVRPDPVLADTVARSAVTADAVAAGAVTGSAVTAGAVTGSAVARTLLDCTLLDCTLLDPTRLRGERAAGFGRDGMGRGLVVLIHVR